MVISKYTTERFTWRDVCDGWTLLESAELHVLLERMPPETHEVPHLHRQIRQLYFVLEGTATVRFENGVEQLGPLEAVEIEPGSLHQMRNDSARPLEFLVISSAAPRSDRVDF